MCVCRNSHPRTVNAIRKLQKTRHIPVIISSGKQYGSCVSLRQELEIPDDVPSAHCNGGIIQRGVNGSDVLKNEGLTTDAVLQIAEITKDRGCFVFFADTLAYISKDTREGARDWLAFASQFDLGAQDCSTLDKRKEVLDQVEDGRTCIKMTISCETEEDCR